jgi:hypothetical protein
MTSLKRDALPVDRVEAVIKAVDIAEASKQATEVEHHTTVWEAARAYPKAIAWSAFFSIAVIMTGYDCQIITSFFAQPDSNASMATTITGNSLISLYPRHQGTDNRVLIVNTSYLRRGSLA